MAKNRGSIAFFATFRPPVELDIFARPLPPASNRDHDELHLTDGKSYNYNGQVLPPAALCAILKRLKLDSQGIYREADVYSGRLSGMIFVSERDSLETLHVALRFNDDTEPKVFSLAEVFDTSTFGGVRMEDSGCIAGDYLIYVSTKEPAEQRRQPWTAVYRTNLETGKTDRLTPKGQADLSPAVSPSGKKIAVASFEGKEGNWKGEIEDLKTNIFVMDVEEPFNRKMVVRHGGWPTWGSDDIIFFHRKVGDYWGVFRIDISSGTLTDSRVTPDGIDAFTPAALDPTMVAVASIHKKSKLDEVDLEKDQHRHIEIYDSSTDHKKPIQITKELKSEFDHFNPFVLDIGGNKHIGYHRCKSDLKSENDIPRQFYEIESPDRDVGLFRVSGVFPTFSKDGSKLAFVDNEFKSVWVADGKELRQVFKTKEDNIFSTVWNQNPVKDRLYVCFGPSFKAEEKLDICVINNVSKARQQRKTITKSSNNAFPSTNREGTKLVFRSTRHGGKERHKNLYIMDADLGEYGYGDGFTRLTEGHWTDTHCQWSPNSDWIVFSSTRDKPEDAPDKDNELDPGYFAIYLVNANNRDTVIRVMGSGSDLAGHVNHPFFSPDEKSIVVTADLAAVSADPISLPHFLHSVRPYGDIFTVDIDIDPDDMDKNRDVKEFKRITHSRYESATGSWTEFSTRDKSAAWNLHLDKHRTLSCPYRDGTAKPIIPKKSC
ncbi:hypothetical protein TIFTF001_033614 [Ficus carica]|uniref:Uncharacterized protein n=1 Tax=Ficus carica TaxID=3494 RepID=A0AA88J406_FICCA|nr:hypothetical protein TIFTF001_033614 [Ficus carica]